VAWTDERIATLKDLWGRGLSANEIASRLGGVSRNAVIGKAHRLGLEAGSRDPIHAIAGASLPAADLLRFRWTDGPKYLQPDCARAFHAACALSAARGDQKPTLVTAHHLIDAIIGVTRYGKLETLSRRIGDHIAAADISVPTDALEVVDRLLVPPHDKAVDKAVLRWDVTEILQRAAEIRRRTGESAKPVDLRHVLCGAILTPAGHLGFSDAGLLTAGFDRLQRLALAVVADARNGGTPGHPEWAHIETEIRSQRPLGFQTEARPDYTSDRVVPGRDAIGVSRDARALANLILLEAAEPPLAIGVFGAWGSGKSTLLAELRSEIHRQTSEERDRIAAGNRSEDGLERISGVIQVDFNAWSFADSENLWASLTAELFDQIAAGGHDLNVAGHGTRLVHEVAARTGRETLARSAAEARLKASATSIADAEASILRSARRDRTSIVEASVDAILELFGPAAEGDRADKAKIIGDAADRSALAPIRGAILAAGTIEPDERIRAYVEASSSMVRYGLLFRDYVTSRASIKSWAGLLIGLVVSFIVVAWLQGRLTIAMPSVSRWWTWLAPVVPVLLATTSLVLPAWRALGTLNKKIGETKALILREKAEAETKLKDGLLEKSAAEIALRESDAFLTKFSGIEDMASAPPSLMLDYLLKESVDIASIRGKMGFLATVRRCFDQLNAVIEYARSTDANNPVQRIVIYLDDLDRCSERQVVQVLEAIHLLLAYPCFVVVAAVDARWLQHALTDQHQALVGYGVSPADYLEKIFQIPYWVRPLDDGTDGGDRYRRYMSSLLGSADPRGPVDAAAGPAGSTGSDGVSTLLRRVAPYAPEERSVKLSQRLSLSGAERNLLLALGPLAARSPRAVKRMVNLYRLIRVSIEKWDEPEARAGRLEDTPSCAAVLLMLACEVGFPPETMTRVARALAQIHDDDWTSFLGAAAIEEDLPPCEFTNVLNQGAVADRFVRALNAAITVTDGMIALEDIHLALSTVAKFSFRLTTTD